jgi:hypothetical protein
MSKGENLLERLLDWFQGEDPDQEEAIEVMLIVVARLAVDQGWELDVISDLVEKIKGTVEMDDKDAAVQEGMRLQ